jgi:uncharacterized protein
VAEELEAVDESEGKSAGQLGTTFLRTWYYLLLGVVVAAVVKLGLDQSLVSGLLRRHRKGSVVAATAAAVTTPLCSCGTMAVILGMLATSVPWAPVVAFMVASPLTSPEELVVSAGLFGWPFALAFFGASIVLGLLGGAAAFVAESRGWLAGQARFQAPSCGCSGGVPTSKVPEPAGSFRRLLPGELWRNGTRLVLLFGAFGFLGYFVSNLIPPEWVGALFGGKGRWGVPLAANPGGVPLYVNSEASLPLVRAFIDSGASQGAALALLITGAGTSLGAITGALAIARRRVIGLVVATLWVGAIVVGATYNLLQLG